MTVNTVSETLDPSSRIQWSIWLLRFFYVVSAVFVVAVLAFNIIKPIKVLPRISLAPGFVFTNQSGASKTSEDFRGKLVIYNFTYSGCTDGCPQTTPQMLSLRNALAQSTGQNVKFALVTISIDPEHDTLDSWSKYAAQFLTEPQGSVSWDFLTGDVTRTKYVVGGGFSVYYQNITDQSGLSFIKFEPRYVLVDGWGIVRAEYRDAELDIPLVIRDVGYLESEIRNSHGAARYAYEAAHLFRCYP